MPPFHPRKSYSGTQEPELWRWILMQKEKSCFPDKLSNFRKSNLLSKFSSKLLYPGFPRRYYRRDSSAAHSVSTALSRTARPISRTDTSEPGFPSSREFVRIQTFEAPLREKGENTDQANEDLEEEADLDPPGSHRPRATAGSSWLLYSCTCPITSRAEITLVSCFVASKMAGPFLGDMGDSKTSQSPTGVPH
ncbi:hypothetical protein AGIG_G19115 [Arapaima gigas]